MCQICFETFYLDFWLLGSWNWENGERVFSFHRCNFQREGLPRDTTYMPREKRKQKGFDLLVIQQMWFRIWLGYVLEVAYALHGNLVDQEDDQWFSDQEENVEKFHHHVEGLTQNYIEGAVLDWYFDYKGNRLGTEGAGKDRAIPPPPLRRYNAFREWKGDWDELRHRLKDTNRPVNNIDPPWVIPFFSPPSPNNPEYPSTCFYKTWDAWICGFTPEEKRQGLELVEGRLIEPLTPYVEESNPRLPAVIPAVQGQTPPPRQRQLGAHDESSELPRQEQRPRESTPAPLVTPTPPGKVTPPVAPTQVKDEGVGERVTPSKCFQRFDNPHSYPT
jgi:hypothetical protein